MSAMHGGPAFLAIWTVFILLVGFGLGLGLSYIL